MARCPENGGLYAALERAHREARHDVAESLERALSALRRYPVPLTTLSAMRKLAGFNDKVLAIATVVLDGSNPAGDTLANTSIQGRRDARTAARIDSPASVVVLDTAVFEDFPKETLAQRLALHRAPPVDSKRRTERFQLDGSPARAHSSTGMKHGPPAGEGSPVLLISPERKRPLPVLSRNNAASGTKVARLTSNVEDSFVDQASSAPQRNGDINASLKWTCDCCGRVYVGVGLRPHVLGALRMPQRWDVAPQAVRGATARHPCRAAARLRVSGTVIRDACDHVCELDVSAWEVVLCVDTREVRTRADRTYIADRLRGRGVLVDVRALALGDFMWIARRRAGAPRPPVPPPSDTPTIASLSPLISLVSGAASKKPAARSKAPKATSSAGSKRKAASASLPPWEDTTPGASEWVLDAIVERKAVRDLASSIMDGRYAEQKQRLNGCGLRVTYIIEGDQRAVLAGAGGSVGPSGGSGRPTIGSAQILGAAVTTQVQNHFNIVATPTVDATIEWLVKMHNALSAQFYLGGSCILHGDRDSPTHAKLTLAAVACAEAKSRAAAGDPFVLLGRGDVGSGVSQENQRASASGHAASVVGSLITGDDTVAHLCRNDRCNLWGRAAIPHGGAMTYADFHAASGRNRSQPVLLLFGQMLRQVAGFGAARAQAVVERFKTPASLARAYDALGPRLATEGPGLLRDMVIPTQRNLLGPAASAAIFRAFNQRTDDLRGKAGADDFAEFDDE